MALEDFIMLNAESKENFTKLRKAVLKTKWFSRFSLEELTTDVLEEGYKKITKKYPVRIAYIMNASERAWSIMIKRSDSHVHIHTISALTLHEGFCKAILVLYGYLVKGKPFESGSSYLDEEDTE